MYKRLPVLLIVCGLLLIVGSFLIGASNAIPFQDPTPQQLAQQSSRSAMVRFMFSIGVLDVVAGLCMVWVRRRNATKARASQSTSKF